MSTGPFPIVGKPLEGSRIVDIQSQDNYFWATSPLQITDNSNIIADNTNGPSDLTQQVCRLFRSLFRSGYVHWA
jgi:hypothetical protein